jgi:hypothetical protein
MKSPAETNSFQQIVGEQLSAVTFVMDYLQLQFNPPPTITIYTQVIVSSGNKTCSSSDDQFRNMLCEQITKIVKSVEIRNEEAFRIIFEDGTVISLSLKASDYTGPEALEILGRDEKRMIV